MGPDQPPPPRMPPVRPRQGVTGPRGLRLRRADLAAVLIGVAAVAYTAVALTHSGSAPSTGATGGRPLPAASTSALVSQPAPAPGDATPSEAVTPSGDTTPSGDASAAAGDRTAGGSRTAATTGRTPVPTAGGVPAPPWSSSTGRSATGRSAATSAPALTTSSSRASAPGTTTRTTTTTTTRTTATISRTTTTTSTNRPTTTTTSRATTTTTTTTTPPAVQVPCSRPTLRAALVTFHNTGASARRLAWVSSSCRIVPQTLVPAGGRVLVATFVGTVWAFLDPATDRPVGSTTISPGQRDAWLG